MKTHKIVFLLALSFFLFSCENELEINPTDNLPGELAITSETNVAAILIGVYDEAGQIASYGGRLQMLSDLLGTDTEVNWTGTFVQPREAFTKSFLIDNTWVRDVWGNAFETINQANLVIDNIDIVTSSAEEKARIEGEAKFLRALAYFDLVRNFGAPYIAGGSNSQLAVPLRLNGLVDFSVNLDAARDTVEEVYTQVISDAQEAYALLPESNSFFADRYAAQALLARVYFQQENYAAARDAANDVLLNSGHSLAPTFDDVFNKEGDGPEDIFSFQVTSQTGANNLVNHYASEADGGRGGDIVINDDYLALFDDPENDERASYVYTNPANEKQLTNKYRQQFANIFVFRIAEMHLIRLESNFREGTSVGLDPLTEINALRSRSGASALAGPLTNDLIFNERQLELGFEGFLIHDIKRTQRSVGTIPFDADVLVYPIPQTEMDTNPLMVQNPGYGE